MSNVSPEDSLLNSFAVSLANAWPDRLVTRALKDFADRKPADLKKGIFTVIADGLPAGDPEFQFMKFLVVGQIAVGEKDDGFAIEKAELSMHHQVRTFIQRMLRGPELKIGPVEQSAQLELPHGWISIAITAGPYDATEPLTEDYPLAGLTDFLRFRGDIDIGRPHQSGEVQRQWLEEPPNYLNGAPDAQLDTDLSGSPT